MNFSKPLIALACIIGAVGLFAVHTISDLKARVAELEANAAEQQDRLKSSMKSLQVAEEKVKTQKEAITALEERNHSVAPANDTTTSADPSSAKPKKAPRAIEMVKEMMKDPEMKKAMRSQQEMVLRMSYGDLATELGLSKEESDQVMALLLDRQMEGIESGGKSAAGRDDNLKSVLGADRFARFEEYEKTVPDRTQVKMWQNTFEGSGTPLTAAQNQQLVKVLGNARTTISQNGPVPDLTNPQGVQDFMKVQEQVNARALNDARAFLSPDQIVTLEKAQKQMLEMTGMGMKMSSKFLGGE